MSKEKKLTTRQGVRVMTLVCDLERERLVFNLAKKNARKAADSIIRIIGRDSFAVIGCRKVMSVHMEIPSHDVGEFEYDTVIVRKVVKHKSKEAVAR